MTYDARYDIKATCTSSNHPVPQLRWRQSKIQTQDPVFSWENSKKKKNHISPLWPGATPPPQRLFFSLECGSELFSQPLQRATTGPRSLGSTEGVAPGRRGAYVTQHAQEASRWEKKTHREMTERRKERGQGVCIWKVFSAPRQGPSLCGSDKERKSIAADAKREGAAKPAMSFITIGGSGNMFKAFRPTSKKPFYSQTKSTGRQPTARQGVGSRSFTAIHFSVRCTFAFCLQLDASSWEPSLKKIKTYVSGLGSLELVFARERVGLHDRGGAISVTANTSLHGPLQMQSLFISCNHHRATGQTQETDGGYEGRKEERCGLGEGEGVNNS